MNIENLDHDEVNKFDELAARWWDKNGEFKPLHQINPLRVGFIKERSALEGKKGSSDLGDYKNVTKIPKTYKPTPRGHKRAAKAERTRSDRGAYPTSK